METLIIITLLVVAAETTYLFADRVRSTRRSSLAPVFIDTSVLIDGRIVSIAESGFMTQPLYIPRSVVGELQYLADNADTDKRTRARHGLDVIKQLQSLTTVEVKIFADGVRAEEGVDNRLLKLAKKYKGTLCTIDYNLNKVAVVEGLQVLNVNDLAKTLRMAYLPGEKLVIELTQKGNDSHQAVGHLGDGTMVVVEQAGKFVGKSVEVEFIRSLQTAAGKMMFAKLAQAPAVVRTQKPVPTVRPRSTTNRNKPVNARAQQTQTTQASNSDQPQVRSQEQSKTQPPRRRHDNNNQSSRRRQSPEDALVNLANRQQ